MSFRAKLRNSLSSMPVIEGFFRRFVWSRIHFIEKEMQMLSTLPRKSFDIAVDVGAGLGEYSWILSRKSAQVYAFEPGNQHSRYLKPLVLGSAVTLIRAAVGASEGTVRLFTPGAKNGALYSAELYWATASRTNPITHADDVSVEEVPLVSLDGFFADRLSPGRSIDLIKIDVEGYEAEVIEGAKTIILEHHPIIVCETEKRHNPDYQVIFSFLREAGYQCYIIKDSSLEAFDDETIDALQNADLLPKEIVARTENSVEYKDYINNFVFQHPRSRAKLVS
jgi:FkbM family methyltransferase